MIESIIIEKIKSRENCVQGKQSSKLRTAERDGCRRRL